MTERDFWEIIDKLDPAGEDLRKIAFPAIEVLSQRSEDDIREFQNILSEKLFRIDGEAWAKRIGDKAFDGNKSTFDTLHFLHARCCVIANGRAFYEDVRRNPNHMPGNQTFATLLTIVPRAYETKMGAPLEHHTSFSRETFSNRWAWDKSQLAIIAFPPLVLLPLMPPVVTGFAIATLLISAFRFDVGGVGGRIGHEMDCRRLRNNDSSASPRNLVAQRQIHPPLSNLALDDLGLTGHRARFALGPTPLTILETASCGTSEPAAYTHQPETSVRLSLLRTPPSGSSQ